MDRSEFDTTAPPPPAGRWRAAPAAAPAASLLTARGLAKRFPGVMAVTDFDLSLAPGEIVALLGQNGAGKSTVIQILAGAYPSGSYSGTMELDGQPYAPRDVAEAEAAGIVLIPQEVNVVPQRTVAENMFLNREPGRYGLIDRLGLLSQARDVLRDFEIDVDPAAPMGVLDLATQQLVVIARALSTRARLLILDEPTAALTEAEAQQLFARMRALRGRGVTCIFVSHRLAEVFAVADRILVMRDGRLVGDHRTTATSRQEVVAEMIGGAPVELSAAGEPRDAVALGVEELTVYDSDDPPRKRVDDLSFALREGEILGLFGLLGAGCGAAATALFGAWTGQVTGSVHIRGELVPVAHPSDAIAHQMGLMLQDRRETLIHDHTVADNIVLASLPSISPRGVIDRDRKRLVARDYVSRLGIRTPTLETRVATLSGGNQQKVQVARWLAAGSRILLLVDPTRGVDVGARAEIIRLWQELAADGIAILLVSSEAEELVEVCHRVLVMRGGQLVSEHVGSEISVGRLLGAAAGVS